MNKLFLILAIVSFAACSKKEKPTKPRHGTDQVSWRFVLYDSNSRVVDSTVELYTDSGAVTLLGPTVTSPIGTFTTNWQMAASFFMVIGPRTINQPSINIPVADGGCVFRVSNISPALDRTGWMLQRTENGQRINMYSGIQGGSVYDGKYNSFPYRVTIDGISYPTAAQSDVFISYVSCGTTQNSCQFAPTF